MGVRVRQKFKGRGNPWWVFISHNGKRTSRKVGDKKAAEAVASTIRAKLQLGEFGFEDPKPVPTLGEYSKRWLKFIESQCKGREPKYKLSTLEEYEGILRLHVLPTLKDCEIDNINKARVRDHLISKLNTLSKRRVESIMSVMSNVFELALEDDVIDANPTSKISKRLFSKNGYKKKPIEKTEIFTPDELNHLLEVCKDNYKEYYLFNFMAARTGMRLGELLALQWVDIDFNSKYIWVKRSYRRGRTTNTKTGKSRKTDMSDQLAEILEALLTEQKREALKQGTGEVTGLIFDYGRLNRERFIQRQYKRILKKAGLRYIKFHGLRNAFCAHLLSKGVSPYYVSQQAGHSSINITCDVYGSWIRGEDNRHVNLLDQVHPNAPQVHPVGYKKSQPKEITVNY